MFASVHGYFSAVKLLLAGGAAVEARDPKGRTALHRPAAAGHTATAAVLLAAGASLQAADELGRTPLHHAVAFCQYGSANMIKLLLKSKHVNASAATHDGTTPLHCAVRRPVPELESAKLLLAAGADESAADERGMTALHYAAARGNAKAMQLLVDAGASIHAADITGQTPLHLAVTAGKRHGTEAAAALISSGSNVCAADNQGRTPLHVACLLEATGQSAMVRLLLAHKADVNAADHSGWTALHYAAQVASTDTVAALLETGADVAAHDASGCIPLHNPACQGDSAVTRPRGDFGSLELLLAAGADVSAADQDGMTALHYAAARGNAKAIQVLVDAGASVHAASATGRTPLHVAAATSECHGTEAAAVLISSGSKLSAVDIQGRTPLHTACLGGSGQSAAMIRLLSAHKADVNAADHRGRTALHYAALGVDLEATNLLLDAGADVEAVSNSGCTALLIVVSYLEEGGRNAQQGQLPVVQRLIQAGARVDAALCPAVAFGTTDVVEALLAAGANVHGAQDSRLSPVYVAAMNGRNQMVSLLLAWQVSVEDTLRAAVLNEGLDTARMTLSHTGVVVTAQMLLRSLKSALLSRWYDMAALLMLHLHEVGALSVEAAAGGQPDQQAAVLAILDSPDFDHAALTTGLLRCWAADVATADSHGSALVDVEQQAAVIMGAHQLLMALRVDQLSEAAAQAQAEEEASTGATPAASAEPDHQGAHGASEPEYRGQGAAPLGSVKVPAPLASTAAPASDDAAAHGVQIAASKPPQGDALQRPTVSMDSIAAAMAVAVIAAALAHRVPGSGGVCSA